MNRDPSCCSVLDARREQRYGALYLISRGLLPQDPSMDPSVDTSIPTRNVYGVCQPGMAHMQRLVGRQCCACSGSGSDGLPTWAVRSALIVREPTAQRPARLPEEVTLVKSFKNHQCAFTNLVRRFLLEAFGGENVPLRVQSEASVLTSSASVHVRTTSLLTNQLRCTASQHDALASSNF